jgi:hypothetical protein
MRAWTHDCLRRTAADVEERKQKHMLREAKTVEKMWVAQAVAALVAGVATLYTHVVLLEYLSRREPATTTLPLAVAACLTLMGTRSKWFVLGALMALAYVYALMRGLWYEPPFKWEMCAATPTYETFVVTIPRSEWRSHFLRHQLTEREGLPYSLVGGVDARDFPTFANLFEGRPVVTVQQSMHDEALLLSHTLAIAKPVFTEWVVVFEDDAQLLDGFADKLERVLCAYSEMDVVWLDTRTSMHYGVFGDISDSAAGMAYKAGAASRVSEMLMAGSPERTEAESRNVYPSFDVLLAWFCNSGLLRCGAAGLVRESDLGAFRTQI